MGFFDKYPYNSAHELNLDWVISEIKKLRNDFDEFALVNSLKYEGEWDITKPYSAFSVVDYGGFGYLSLQPTPPGTQLNNTDYWLMIVDFSAIYNDFGQRITDLETVVGDSSSGLVKDVNDLETVVGDSSSGLVKDVNDLETVVGDSSSGLVKDVNDLETVVGDSSSGLVKDVADLQNDVSDLYNLVGNIGNRKFIFCGDSYSVGSYGVTGWIDNVESYLGLTDGVNAFDARNLVGYYGGSFGADTFKNQIIALGGYITNPNTITDIYLFAGANEYTYTTSDTMLGMTNFMYQCKNYFPNAKVHIGFIGALVNSANNKQFGPFIKTYKRIGEIGGYYVDGSEYINSLYSNYHSDGIHPNDYEPMSKLLARAILQGSIEVSKEYRAMNYTAGSGASTLHSCAFNMVQHNDYLNISGSFNFVASTAISNTAVTIATRTTPIDIINPSDDDSCVIPIKVVYILSGTIKTYDAVMIIRSTEIKLLVLDYEGNNPAVIPAGALVGFCKSSISYAVSVSASTWQMF